MSNLGMGVMLGLLGGNEKTVNSIKNSLNKVIKEVILDKSEDILKIYFEDESAIKIWDGGQSCCEHRYMSTDDDLPYFSGSTLLDIELKDGPVQEGEWGDMHEVQFLDIKTDKGTFQMSNHNEHNGYYGGFWVQASPLT
jgi:hypothetical protein